MPHSNEYLQYVLEQLAGLPGLVSRRMFGGAGLYQDELFFGLIFADTLYFKVNDDNRASYEARGMDRFRPYKNRPQVSLTYYEVPPDVLEDREELVTWAHRSLQAAAASRSAKSTRAATHAKSKHPKHSRPKRKRKAPQRTQVSARTPRGRATFRRQPPK